MNVAIDITPLSSGHKDRGVGKYTKLLVKSLQKYEQRHSYTTFVRGQNIPDNVDLVHYPYFDPFFLTPPGRFRKPTVVTVHDLIPIVFPDKFPRGIRGEVKWQIQKATLKNATRIIADSESSKRDVVRFTGIDERKIIRVYLAPDPAIIEGANGKREGERFILYVGDLNWNKNVSGLLLGFARAKTGVNLVIVGSAFLDEKLPEAIAIHKQVKNLGLEARVKFVGHVTDEKLGALYASSVGCVLSSFYEGFGLPVLEAMSCGAPVICSRGSSLDEIAGPSLRVDAYDIDSIAAGVTKLANLSKQDRKSLMEKGKTWSNNFTWEKAARETVRVYESCI